MGDRSRKQVNLARHAPRRSSRDDRVSLMLYAVGGLALIGLAGLVIANIPDLKRYIKISTM